MALRRMNSEVSDFDASENKRYVTLGPGSPGFRDTDAESEAGSRIGSMIGLEGSRFRSESALMGVEEKGETPYKKDGRGGGMFEERAKVERQTGMGMGMPTGTPKGVGLGLQWGTPGSLYDRDGFLKE